MTALYTTRQYPCGCKAEGTGDVPDYCSEHGTPPALRDPDQVRERGSLLLKLLEQRNTAWLFLRAAGRCANCGADLSSHLPNCARQDRWSPSGDLIAFVADIAEGDDPIGRRAKELLLQKGAKL